VTNSVLLADRAPAKVNLTLRVIARRPDGYHELESLVVFADVGDRLTIRPGEALALTVHGPRAEAAGENADNLVLKAARALAARVPDLILGRFELDKRLPVAAGLGGGSSDAAAALRLLADVNGLAADDPRLYEAARATGADVPVCLDPRPRVMRGIGEKLSEPLAMPSLPAVLVNPGVAVPTKAVFAQWKPAAEHGDPPPVEQAGALDDAEALMRFLASQTNDLERPAIVVAPVISEVLSALRTLPGCRLARMSGSGATCIGLFASTIAAQEAAELLQRSSPQWWIVAGKLGSATRAAAAEEPVR
jgi:4-diphosphocytidyl-2-C-methyl-D-erythritol kinase